MPPPIAVTFGNVRREGEKESKGHRGVRRHQAANPAVSPTRVARRTIEKRRPEHVCAGFPETLRYDGQKYIYIYLLKKALNSLDKKNEPRRHRAICGLSDTRAAGMNITGAMLLLWCAVALIARPTGTCVKPLFSGPVVSDAG